MEIKPGEYKTRGGPNAVVKWNGGDMVFGFWQDAPKGWNLRGRHSDDKDHPSDLISFVSDNKPVSDFEI